MADFIEDDIELTEREGNIVRAALIEYRHNGSGRIMVEWIDKIIKKLDATEADRLPDRD